MNEYEPLLPPGRHPHDLEDLTGLCVEPFAGSPTRSRIMQGLRDVHARLERTGVPGEMWVNGSFLTRKPDPEDADIVVCLPPGPLSPAAAETLEWLQEDLKPTHMCDTYAFVRYGEGDRDYWFGEYMYCYWMRQWGFSRSEEFKGMAAVRLPEPAGETP